MNLKIAFGAAALALVLVACGGKTEVAVAPAAETAAPVVVAPADTATVPAAAPVTAPADAPKQ